MLRYVVSDPLPWPLRPQKYHVLLHHDEPTYKAICTAAGIEPQEAPPPGAVERAPSERRPTWHDEPFIPKYPTYRETMWKVLCLVLSGRCLGAVWALSGRCLGAVWVLSGRCLGAVWALSGRCLGAVWALSGRCLGAVWALSGRCLGAVWALIFILGRLPGHEKAPSAFGLPSLLWSVTRDT